ncbi:hypothetical protein DCAR_0312851 [Daucus carota subsp. sativus]|uniref:Integrase catalytic domain-containing protein n=1 Tax=Daucus carota subsp. sativus TaxID=79200 RepID=A0AAF0WT24_DAUCS|nr:hypothetical protein DCAR_0312851 [Daucus carota subsp. sativus]
MVEHFFKFPIISVYSDNGGEYIALNKLFQECGISHFTTPPHTPEHNGSAERKHRHVTETGLTLLQHAGLPLSYWSHAFQTATYLINRMPTPILSNRSPYEILFHQPPNYTRLKIFGCLCYPWLRPYSTSKLQPKSTPCLFLGYSTTKSAYKCLDYSSNRLYTSRHVVFVESIFPLQTVKSTPANPPSLITNKPPPSHQTIHVHQPLAPPPIIRSSTDITPPEPSNSIPTTTLTPSSSIENETHRPIRARKPNPKYYGSTFVNNTTTNHPLPSPIEPTCVSQAVKDSNWRSAMSTEFNALIQNGTWTLVPKRNQNVIGCKWVFRLKRNSDGTIARYKARLVAKGFHQRPGIDFTHTFAPVTKPVTIRVILSIALSKGWPLRQLDINNAFLNGTLSQQVFMQQPPGFIDSQFPDYVCSPYEWHQKLKQFLIEFGFTNSVSDASLFIYSRNNCIMYFLVYVDDIILTGNHSTIINDFVATLNAKFSLKDLGSLNQFLGVEVVHTSDGVFLSQHRHIADILINHNMANAKPVGTPLSTSETLRLNDGSCLTDASTYRKIVGSLQYLTVTRPDVAYAVNRLSQFMHQPTEKHLQSLKRLLRYLKQTIHHGLFLKRGQSIILSAFSDSDWGGCREVGRSTTGYAIYLGSNIISWRSARQKSVSRSSTEAEYKALANASAELIWIRNLLRELGFQQTKAPTLFCDNTGATYLAANPIFHSRVKHIALDYHFVREQVQSGQLHVCHVNTKDQIADILTKPLARPQFMFLRSKIGVSCGASILRGRVQASPE